MSVTSSIIPNLNTTVPRRHSQVECEDLIHKELDRHEMISLRGQHLYRLILCRKGMLWITQKNDPEDYVLHEGESFLVTLSGRVIIQALQKSSMEISSPITARPYKGDLEYFS